MHPKILVSIIIVCVITSSVTSEPKVVHLKYGIVADPSDDTIQCLGRLCIGNEFSSVNEQHLKEEGISHIVSANEGPTRRLDGINYLVIGLYDSTRETNLMEGIERSNDFVHTALTESSSARVLIHCSAGISRSSSLFIAYLLRYCGYETYEDAITALKGVRSIVQPNDTFEFQLQMYAELLSAAKEEL